MSANAVRKHISNLMKQGSADPLGDQLERELSEMDENQGPNVEEKADNADAIIKARQRGLANVGYIAAMHHESAAAVINTAHAISTGEEPTEKEAKKTYVSANRMLQSLFRYYSDEDETK